ncbi:putative late blight resistance protein homolog R1B-8 [Salvia hispanica]|uniref:putative late blight resistance protein homolog R1B-8 n=1 Tax=Salvia hispanica TaxID=49212 RepID=UPI002008FFA6|nr:putative late blight resistance protein homolog R1B-8 [Salvia hispanica]
MAAYGALVSLMHIIDTLEKHPSPPISIDKKQVQSLTQNITFLQEFLDSYISPVVVDGCEADPLERRIADAVYAAEDVIESQIVVQIDKRSTFVEDPDFYQDLQKVIEEMDLIKKEVGQIAVKDQKPVADSTSSSTVKENVMVGFEEVYLEVLDKLTGDELNRQIIPITGMGGIGKTTLAKNLFKNALVKEYFDIRAWTTISQTYNVRETLREVYIQSSGQSRDRSENEKLSESELGGQLYKFLYGRRYLVTMDDMWSVEVWDKIKVFFPDNKNGSRIIVTTRLSNLSLQLNESYRVGMKFLDEISSWGLFCKTVFAKESCPLELENIGKNIVANCKGLPLSIATIGGLLAKSECTREYWEHIEQNLNSIIFNSNDEFCLKLLRMSYIYLPNYLKPCFLYMGVFEEDRSIQASMLEKLWISEGFLKPRGGKCLETIAHECLMELVDRNLILVDELGSIGNVKYCKIHDILRDLCLKEGEKERFYQVIGRDDPLCMNGERRVVLKTRRSLKILGSWSHTRSIICDYNDYNHEYESDAAGDEEGRDSDDDEEKTSDYEDESGDHIDGDKKGRDNDDNEEENDYEDEEESDHEKVRPPHNLRLLRTFKAFDEKTGMSWLFLDNVFESVNSRYIAVRVTRQSKFPSSIDLLWNLHTLIISCSWDIKVPVEIWRLHQLRHLVYPGYLPDPPSSDNDIVILENLQTLKAVLALCLNEEVVKRIPNVKKLSLRYHEQVEEEKRVSHIQSLPKLENLDCYTSYEGRECWQWIRFPHTLKKLSVGFASRKEVENIMSEIGSLPLLEKLVLRGGFFKAGKWETIEGQFPNLKFLQLDCNNLKEWIVSDKSHFPLLQKLSLIFLSQLEEIPSEVGEIATLKSIVMTHCSESAVVSAKRIVEEQEELYGDQLDLHVVAAIRIEEEALNLMSLANANFEVQVAGWKSAVTAFATAQTAEILQCGVVPVVVISLDAQDGFPTKGEF